MEINFFKNIFYIKYLLIGIVWNKENFYKKKWILKFKSKDFIKICFGYNTLIEILNFLYGHSPIT